ncbi:MAG: DNA recombination protein RmuC [bacterium]
MDPLITLAALVSFVLLVAITYRLYSKRGDDSGQSALLFQQQVESIRNEVRESLQGTTTQLNQRLDATTQTVNQQLTIVTSQLSSVTQQLQNNTGQVGSRLDTAAKVIQDVQNKLGELGKATQEIKELGQSVSKLEEMLKAPKLRGGLGELLLEDLLKQVLSASAYGIQYRFKSGHVVDAIIRMSGGIVPVDSKFPLENFQKMLEAKSEQEKKTATRLFRTDVKKHIDAIADKYILTDEGTFNFALMYIPAENIFYETIIKDESFAEEDGLQAYAAKRHVIPVSPNSFYAYLNVIVMGLKGMQIERSAKEIIQQLDRLGSELQKFSDVFETLGGQLNNAKNNYDKADKQLSSLRDKFTAVRSIPGSDGEKQLEAFGGK